MHSQICDFNGHNDHPMIRHNVSAIHCLACAYCTADLLDKVGCRTNCQPENESNLLQQSQSNVSVMNQMCVDCDDDVGDVDVVLGNDENSKNDPINTVESNTVGYICGFWG